MITKGPHEWLRLEVVWPPATDPSDQNEENDSEFALAVSLDVFNGHQAGEIQNLVRIIPNEIGGVVLREGHVLQAFGNTRAHDGKQLEDSLTDISFLED